MKINTATLEAVTAPASEATKGMSPEEMIAYFARVSNPENQHNTKTAPKLLLYLIQQGHWSPFSMVSLTVKVKTTRAIMQQVLRHWTMDFQEFSQRYSAVEDMDFTGVNARMKHAGGNRQGSGDEDQHLTGRMQELCAESACNYDQLINDGVAPECARMILPAGVPTTAYITASVRTMITYFWQRLDPHAQKEHQDLAWSIFAAFEEAFPVLADIVTSNKPVVVQQVWCRRPGVSDQPELFVNKYPAGLPPMNHGEPWFLLRAKDACMPPAIQRYLRELEDAGLLDNVKSVAAFLGDVGEWRDANPDLVRNPD